MQIPKRLELIFFQGENSLPVLKEVKSVFENGKKEDYILHEMNLVTLLARPDIALLALKSYGGKNKYEKKEEVGHAVASTMIGKPLYGSMIYVSYELID